MNDKLFHRFIVTGVPTAGKSTFSHQLVRKYFVQHICIDPIIEAFEDVFPQLGITHNAPTLEEHLDVCQKFRPFICRMIDGLDVDDFVIEGFRLPLEDLRAQYPALQFFVFGYPNATPQNRLARVREFDVANWTNGMTDDELLETFEFLIQESKRLQSICGRLGIPFVDTGLEYWPQINWAMEQTK